MKLSTNIFLCALILFTATLTGCKKEGPPGADGADGNANVVSAIFTATNWSYSSPSYYVNFNYSEITQNIIDKGAVLVYIRVGTGYNQLPLTFYQDASYSTTAEVSTNVGTFGIIWTDSDLIEPNYPGSQTFKVVVIAASRLAENPSVDFTNYEEVARVFDIEE